jgi:tRNA threonylcarbamoyladenosine biosynthesis protein TsaB
MSRALVLETSGRLGAVGLAVEGEILERESFEHGLAHAARIVPAVDGLCRRLGWAAEDLKQIYVSLGPGSFTGLRIGVTLAKTLAFVNGAKVVGVPTCGVIVENVPAEARAACVVLDAKRDQIFTALYVRDGARWVEREPAHLDSLASIVARSPRPLHLVGEGIPFHRKFLDQTDRGIIITGEELWRPDVGVVARLGWEMAQAGRFLDALGLTPIYIRRPEAEEKLGL